jgi:hypothetical protein
LQQTLLPEMRIIKQAVNKGLSCARNTGLEVASGDYIWFIDTDDVVQQGALQQLESVVKKHAPDLVLCDFERFDERYPSRLKNHSRTFPGSGNVLSRDIPTLIEGVFQCGQMHSWSKVTKRALWKPAIRFPEGRYFEDASTTPRLLFEAQSYIHIPQTWIRYRQRDGSILSTMDRQKTVDMMAAFADWVAPQALLTPAAQFRVAQFMFGMFRGACSTLEKVSKDPQVPHLILGFFEVFERQSPLAPNALFIRFMQRGWLWRACRHACWYHANKLVYQVKIP